MCEIDMHKECKAADLLECCCRCHDFEPITLPDVHGSLFAFTKREDGQVVLMVEDDGLFHPMGSFDPAWLPDLSRVAAEAAAKFNKKGDGG